MSKETEIKMGDKGGKGGKSKEPTNADKRQQG